MNSVNSGLPLYRCALDLTVRDIGHPPPEAPYIKPNQYPEKRSQAASWQLCSRVGPGRQMQSVRSIKNLDRLLLVGLEY
mgnify:CR=1 FL=1